jgi:hypothetical protein
MDTVQFPRLLSESYAVLTTDQVNEIAVHMDLTPGQVRYLFHRAEMVFDFMKSL